MLDEAYIRTKRSCEISTLSSLLASCQCRLSVCASPEILIYSLRLSGTNTLTRNHNFSYLSEQTGRINSGYLCRKGDQELFLFSNWMKLNENHKSHLCVKIISWGCSSQPNILLVKSRDLVSLFQVVSAFQCDSDADTWTFLKMVISYLLTNINRFFFFFNSFTSMLSVSIVTFQQHDCY